MGIAVLALATVALSPDTSEGDSIVAVVWARQRRDPSLSAAECIRVDELSTADQIRQPSRLFAHLIAKDATNTRPDPARLRRIAKGEGRTLSFDVRRLGLEAPSPACRLRYVVSAPVALGDHAYVHVGMSCGSLCGGGEVWLLERREGRWQVVEAIAQWNS